MNTYIHLYELNVMNIERLALAVAVCFVLLTAPYTLFKTYHPHRRYLEPKLSHCNIFARLLVGL